jgi:hypothetical protein
MSICVCYWDVPVICKYIVANRNDEKRYLLLQGVYKLVSGRTYKSNTKLKKR